MYKRGPLGSSPGGYEDFIVSKEEIYGANHLLEGLDLLGVAP